MWVATGCHPSTADVERGGQVAADGGQSLDHQGSRPPAATRSTSASPPTCAIDVSGVILMYVLSPAPGSAVLCRPFSDQGFHRVTPSAAIFPADRLLELAGEEQGADLVGSMQRICAASLRVTVPSVQWRSARHGRNLSRSTAG
jgi:hypothetical protein